MSTNIHPSNDISGSNLWCRDNGDPQVLQVPLYFPFWRQLRRFLESRSHVQRIGRQEDRRIWRDKVSSCMNATCTTHKSLECNFVIVSTTWSLMCVPHWILCCTVCSTFSVSLLWSPRINANLIKCVTNCNRSIAKSSWRHRSKLFRRIRETLS